MGQAQIAMEWEWDR